MESHIFHTHFHTLRYIFLMTVMQTYFCIFFVAFPGNSCLTYSWTVLCFLIMQHPCVAVKPRIVRITMPAAPLSAGKAHQLKCETTGSMPPAHIVWLLDGEPLRNAPTSVCIRHHHHHHLRGLGLLARSNCKVS